MTTRWHPSLLANCRVVEDAELPVIARQQVQAFCPNRYYWDQCPILDPQGASAQYRDATLWMALSAPATPDATARHGHAHLRLLLQKNEGWFDCGNLMPDGFSHGSREWAGMALLSESVGLTVYYTATGTAKEKTPTFRQRIFEASATLVEREERPTFAGWQDRGEPVVADGKMYLAADQKIGEPGSIVGFRDPFCFLDTGKGQEFLVFAASSAKAKTSKNGVIGVAVRSSVEEVWAFQPPLIDGDGVTSEMERPHIVHHGGNYYLFWSTHGWTFADKISAPTGLYGMVADSVLGPYEPLNGTGLVVANPAEQPYQAYSWFVSRDLIVSSFVDMLDGTILSGPDNRKYPVGKFEGTLAPEFRLSLEGTSARIAHTEKRWTL